MEVMSKQKNLVLEVTSTGKVKTGKPYPANGWGEDAQKVLVEGEIAEIIIRKGKEGEAVIGLRILPNGDVILTSYNTFFTQPVERNLRLDNGRPWKEDDDEGNRS